MDSTTHYIERIFVYMFYALSMVLMFSLPLKLDGDLDAWVSSIGP